MIKNQIILILLGLVFSYSAGAQGKVTNFKRTFLDCSGPGQKILGLRQFQMNGVHTALIVDVETLQTKIVAQDQLRCFDPDVNFLKDSRYERLRSLAAHNKEPLANAGIVSFNAAEVFLTIDMCPSSKPFEKAFFDWIRQQKIPIGLAISGNWILRHRAELEELKKIPGKITWVNHTYTHPYVAHVPNSQNFLLTAGVQLEHEILDNEILMIENGLTPSVFVRYPGLISSPMLVDKTLSWGLIPLGANAWLALGQKPKPGSVILVHGNSNEPKGIQLFFEAAKSLLDKGFGSLTF